MMLSRATALLLFGAGLAASQTALHPDVPAPFSHAPQSAPKLFAGADGFYIDVPENAFRMVIRMRAVEGSPDVDLHVRHAEDVTLANRVEADISLTEEAADRKIELTRSTNPPLEPGRWFIATAVDSGFDTAAGLVEADYFVTQAIEGTPVEVPALGSLWLAGQPSGTSLFGDQTPINSPTLVPRPVNAGALVQIVATGTTNVHSNGDPRWEDIPAEGTEFFSMGASFNISGLVIPIGGLVGVFTGDDVNGTRPPNLDYQGGIRDLSRLEPQLQQAFYIGNGYTPQGELRTFVAPAGASRLYLAVGEGGGNSSNNSGALTAVVSVVDDARAQITPDGVTNAAGFAARPLAAGSIVTIFGENFGELAAADAVPLPTQLSNTSVWFDTIPAPLYFVSPGQINAQIPWEFDMAREALVTVVHDGNPGVPVKIELEPFRPGVFADDIGPIVINNRTGGLVSAGEPAAAGDALILFANGLGPVAPPVREGVASPADPLARGTITPEVLLDGGGEGVTVRPFFSGLAPNFAGVFQVNFTVPETAPRGEVTLALQAPGFARSEPVEITIQ